MYIITSENCENVFMGEHMFNNFFLLKLETSTTNLVETFIIFQMQIIQRQLSNGMWSCAKPLHNKTYKPHLSWIINNFHGFDKKKRHLLSSCIIFFVCISNIFKTYSVLVPAIIPTPHPPSTPNHYFILYNSLNLFIYNRHV